MCMETEVSFSESDKGNGYWIFSRVTQKDDFHGQKGFSSVI